MIFSCECGKDFVKHSALSHPTTILFELLCHIYKLSEHEISLWEFSAYFADTSHFHRFRNANTCPECRSSNLSFDAIERKTTWELSDSSFNRFLSLSKRMLFEEFEEFLALG
tara:strand:+ start:2121 stop:2456 length:336 start_codon:yes stop_codon:yes gene_type:complete